MLSRPISLHSVKTLNLLSLFETESTGLLPTITMQPQENVATHQGVNTV